MKNISFSMTTEKFRDGSKTVTRRLGWWNLKVGEILMGVEKSQGLKKGEKIVKIHPLQVLDVRKEPLHLIHYEGEEGTLKEGFPGLLPGDFVERFIDHNKAKCSLGAATPVNRIEFKHLSICEKCGEVCAWELAKCTMCWPQIKFYSVPVPLIDPATGLPFEDKGHA